MNSKTLRRLATEHSQLHKKLPPNYLWPPDGAAGDTSDLTQLNVLLAGPDSTPFSTGVFRLCLSIPSNYPVCPPTAAFRTKIFHPNVDPNSGAVCVDTLKRDWTQSTTLYDILVVVSCLLISPNPASALNADAGRLCDGNFAGFEKRARTWVNVHARCPKELVRAAHRARGREDDATEDAADAKAGDERVGTTRRVGEKRKGPIADDAARADGADRRVLGVLTSAGDDVDGSDIVDTVELDQAIESQLPVKTHVQQASSDTELTASTGHAAREGASTLPLSFNKKADAQPSIPCHGGAPIPPSLHADDAVPKPYPTSSAAEMPTRPIWQYRAASTAADDETAPDRSKRRRLEEKRLKAAGGCIWKYNSGAFGARKGLRRL